MTGTAARKPGWWLGFRFRTVCDVMHDRERASAIRRKPYWVDAFMSAFGFRGLPHGDLVCNDKCMHSLHLLERQGVLEGWHTGI
jgi:hypothetical protein